MLHNVGKGFENERFEGLPAISKRTSLPRSTIYDWIAKDLFPRPVRIGPRRVAWRKSEIDRWIAEAIAAEDKHVS